MSDYKPREFWISKGEYDGDLGVPTPFYSSVLTREEVADLWDGKEGFKRFMHVREVLPDVDSKPSTINLKFPAFDEKANELHDAAFTESLERGVGQTVHPCEWQRSYTARSMRQIFINGAKHQHSIDAQHFDAVVTELMEIVEMQREALQFYSDFASGKNNQPIFDDENSNRARIYEKYAQYSIGDLGVTAHKTLAAVDERLVKLNNKETP